MWQGLCSQELYYRDYIILFTHYYYPYVVSPNLPILRHDDKYILRITLRVFLSRGSLFSIEQKEKMKYFCLRVSPKHVMHSISLF